MSSKSGKSRSKRALETSLGQAPKETVDLSHVQKPIETNIFGLKQVLSLFQTATNEVQSYIQYECDVLYECRICRTIFRSLANFILHKRNYCRDKFYKNVNIAEAAEGGAVIECKEEDAAGDKAEKKISPIIDKLLKNHEIQVMSKRLLDEDLSKKPPDDDVVFVSEEKANLLLQPIAETPGVVFQTLVPTDDELKELMKSEVMEIHGIFDNNEVVLGSDGKVCNFRALKTAAAPTPSKQFSCIECKTRFSTQKTLTHHIKYKHNKTCIVFPCPDCRETFANAWGVYRHLYKVHRRTQSQVRRMRAQIHASGIQKSAEPERKKEVAEMVSEENQWMNNFEDDKDLQMCGGCGKRFERKAALQSHSQMCTKRIAICNNIKGQKTASKQVKAVAKVDKVETPPQPPVPLKGAAKRKPVYIPKIVDAKFLDDDDEEFDLEFGSGSKREENKIFINSETEIYREEQAASGEKDPLSLNDVIEPSCELTITKCSPEAEEEKGQEDEEKSGEVDESVQREEVEVFTISDDSNHSMESKKEEEEVVLKRKRSHSSDEDEEVLAKTVSQISAQHLDEFKGFLNDENDHLFFVKALPFMDTKSLSCNRCLKSYESQYQLLWHMSLHFSWYRFQCSKCLFMSFSKFDCMSHAHKQHQTPNALIESTVLSIPKWKVESITHDFDELSVEVLNGMEEKINRRGSAIVTAVTSPSSSSEKLETSDSSGPDLIILEDDEEQIAANNEVAAEEAKENDEDKASVAIEKSPVLSNRPVRNRTKSVKTAHDDFIYDLAKVLKLNGSSTKNGKVRKSASKVVKE